MSLPTSPSKHIGILLFDNVEELDAVGPWEVLSWWTQNHPEDGYTASCFSMNGDSVTCAKGLALGAHHSYATLPALEVLVYPGGVGTRPHLKDGTQLDWLRGQRATVPLLTSVCTGALVLAAAGLLRGRPATTHWGALDLLAEIDPSIEIRPEERFIDDGDVITSSGVSSGIDMALHLIDRLAGVDRVREVRRAIQYDPGPPV